MKLFISTVERQVLKSYDFKFISSSCYDIETKTLDLTGTQWSDVLKFIFDIICVSHDRDEVTILSILGQRIVERVIWLSSVWRLCLASAFRF